MAPSIIVENVVPRLADSPFDSPINWEVRVGEVWGILGHNGSGKSLLGQLIQGKIAVKSGKISYPFLTGEKGPDAFLHVSRYIKIIDFNAAYSLFDYQKLFYQQRFNNSENEELPLVRDLLDSNNLSGENLLVFHEFQLFDLLDRKLIHLSSGELRKFLIAKALLDNPRMLIFDNPFIGLDKESRELLDELFQSLLVQRDIQLLFLAPSLNELPTCVTCIKELKGIEIATRFNGSCQTPCETGDRRRSEIATLFNGSSIDWDFFTLESHSFEGNEMVSMSNIDITYGDRVIQRDLGWVINKDERWALLGPNGSGKSTLLSYIFADNPMAYVKDIRLFGRKRGTGESIWDIKRRIGFTSSEMHLYYRKNVDCITVVASGFFDSIGLFRKCDEQQTERAEKLLEILGIPHLKNRPFLQISSGEQRLVLFARAIVKNPELLILDEPFHGLDEFNKKLCTLIVESFARQPGKSLIYVTHRQEEIPGCIDKYMVLKPRLDTTSKGKGFL